MATDSRCSNLTVCFWKGQRDLIEKAAKAQRMSISDWVRTVLVPRAAEDAGVPLPKFPPFGKYTRGDSGVYQIAHQLGMTVKEFQTQAARKAAEAMLEEFTRPERTGTE